MPAVYVKGGNGTKPEEFSLENVEEYAVAELREAVAGRLHIPLETTCNDSLMRSKIDVR